MLLRVDLAWVEGLCLLMFFSLHDDNWQIQEQIFAELYFFCVKLYNYQRGTLATKTPIPTPTEATMVQRIG